MQTEVPSCILSFSLAYLPISPYLCERVQMIVARYLNLHKKTTHIKKEVIMKRARRTIGWLASGLLLTTTLTGCVATSALVASSIIAGSTPTVTTHTTYVPTTQVVTQVATRPVAQNIKVTATTTDISYNLDLQAVGNIFGVSTDLEDFERRLNAYDTQISNLDLNRDGYVDYLRVVEAQEGYTHVVVIQAVLAQNLYQDVATIEVERYGTGNTITIIGDTYLYGASYVLRPTYVSTPVIYNFFYGPNYHVWRSPYYWGYYPTYYRPRTCVHVNVYHQHIITHNKHYHHTYHYIDDYRPRFEGIRNTVSRNDYAIAHPEESFSRRNSEVRNARGIQVENTRRTAVQASDAVRKEANASSTRRATTSTASKVTTTIETSTSRRASGTTTTATPTTTGKSSTTTATSRRTDATTSTTTTAPKVTTTTSTSSSRRTSGTTTTATPTTTSKSSTTNTSSRRTSSATPQKVSSTTKASMSSGSTTKPTTSVSRRSSASSTRTSSTSSTTRSSNTSSTRSSGSRR